MKRNRKWKIPHTVLEGWIMRFGSYKNCELKVKLWRVKARERKSVFFVTFILSEGNFLNIFVLAPCIEQTFRINILLHIRKHYFIHFWCFFLKLSKAFSVSLTLSAPISQNGQTHSNNSSAIPRRIVWVCLTILWDWRLKGKYGNDVLSRSVELFVEKPFVS